MSGNRWYLLPAAKLKAVRCSIMLTSCRSVCITAAFLTLFLFMFAQSKYGVKKKRPPPPANCLPLGGSCKSPGMVCCDFCAFCQCRLFRTVCYCRMGNPRCWAVRCNSSSWWNQPPVDLALAQCGGISCNVPCSQSLDPYYKSTLSPNSGL